MNGTLYLIDTSIWIEVFPPRRTSASPELVDRIDGLVARDRAAITGMIRFEVLDGTRTEAEYRRLERVLDGLPRITIAERTWDDACRLSFDLKRQGRTIPVSDLVIATAAMQSGAIVIHRDRHFDTIASYTPLRVESYVP